MAGLPIDLSALPQEGIPVFVYGTLMAPEVYRRVVGGAAWAQRRFPTWCPARLWGHRRRAVRDRHYPAVQPGSDDEWVDGLLVWAEKKEDIEKMDEWEDYEYTRTAVTVELHPSPTSARSLPSSPNTATATTPPVIHPAEVYIWNMGSRYLSKHEWSYEEFRRDKLPGWVESYEEEQVLDDLAVGEFGANYEHDADEGDKSLIGSVEDLKTGSDGNSPLQQIVIS
ncbi:hypothetical protein M427DRAFT_132755 [Gonapodya prolifera JEL478]|uniref:Putative gamma-glutamylcyclotransferase n=1 Tax=Gonapodya prolifera (strain JEL478) TaxID=1344416 RepID=A0A139ANS7_GONPJ|nr:hypothetical protein M427DRAFT_132755 [Gonapodya prolifera JEL478]|eukprot:KXS18400.1 hypothetical protein M427DRAFT_132755 [Gonapodya prolifera JEL478]